MVGGGHRLLCLTQLGMQGQKRDATVIFVFSLDKRTWWGKPDCFSLCLQDPGQEEKNSVTWCSRSGCEAQPAGRNLGLCCCGTASTRRKMNCGHHRNAWSVMSSCVRIQPFLAIAERAT